MKNITIISLLIFCGLLLRGNKQFQKTFIKPLAGIIQAEEPAEKEPFGQKSALKGAKLEPTLSYKRKSSK